MMVFLRRCAVFTFCLAQIIFSAGALTIVGWDSDRGGDSSLASADGHQQTRAMIEKNFPKSTIVGVGELTDKAMEKADVVWIGAVAGNTSAIKPLSADEQAALIRFVKRGGMALIFGDNDSFDKTAQETIRSMMDPFKARQEGTLFNDQTFKIETPDKAPFDGPLGKVNSLTGGYVGWFDQLPAAATILAKLENGKPIIAFLPAGTLEKGSGSVWLFGNSCDKGPGGATGGDWDTLFANILSPLKK